MLEGMERCKTDLANLHPPFFRYAIRPGQHLDPRSPTPKPNLSVLLSSSELHAAILASTVGLRLCDDSETDAQGHATLKVSQALREWRSNICHRLNLVFDCVLYLFTRALRIKYVKTSLDLFFSTHSLSFTKCE